MHETIKKINQYTAVSKKLDKNKIPSLFKDILDWYLIPKEGYVPQEALLQIMLVQMSNLVCFNRVQVESWKGGYVFPNVYAICFMPSGAGKDEALNALEDLFEEFNKDQQKQIDKFKDFQLMEIKEKADKLFSDKNEAKKDDYVEKQNIIDIYQELESGSMQALLTNRMDLKKFRLGNTYFQNSEFISYIKSNDKHDADFLKQITSVYNGVSKARKLARGGYPKIKNVPQTMFVHSDISGLFNDEKTSGFLFEFLNRGLCRRSLLFNFEGGDKEVPYNENDPNLIEKYNEQQKVAQDFKEQFTEIVKDIVENLRPSVRPDFENDVEIYEYKNLKLSNEAREILFRFHIMCKNNQKKKQATNNEEKEDFDVALKALKIAGLIACFDNSNKMIVKEDHVLQAIYITTLYSRYTESFYKDRSNYDDYVYNAYTFVKEYPDEKGAPTSKIARNKGMGSRFKKASDVQDLINQLEIYCNERNENLIYKEGNGKSKRYKIERFPEHEEKNIDDITITMSQGVNNLRSCTEFHKKEVKFTELHKLIHEPFTYCATPFKDNKRANDNWIEDQMFIIDIDNGCNTNEEMTEEEAQKIIDKNQLTIKDAKEMFKGYTTLIITTKSHNKKKPVKKGFPQMVESERFRIIFPLAYPINNKGTKEFDNLKDSIIKYFKLKKGTYDGGTLEKSRQYFGHVGEYEYNQGKLFNWKVVPLIEEKKTPIFNKPYVRDPFKSNAPRNADPNLTFKDKQGHVVGWGHFEYLQPGLTAPVYCIHGEKSPSAWICRSDSGENNLFYKCKHDTCNQIIWQK